MRRVYVARRGRATVTETAVPVVRDTASDAPGSAAASDADARHLSSVTPPPRPRPGSPTAPPSPPRTSGRGGQAQSTPTPEAAAAVALARETFGEPEPMSLLRQEGVLRVMGWTLGRGRAECREAGQLAHIVGIDVVLMGDGRYAVCERTATDGEDGLSRLDARCAVFEAPTATRDYCQEHDGDATREAARFAALDHATRRWPPFRGSNGRPPGGMPLPFALD